MNPKKTIVKPSAIGGFPEYSPVQQRQAQKLLDKIRATFELHGFTPIETPAVERLEVLLAKGGDTDKEMFLLKRLDDEAEAAGGRDSQALGLHYDLTVPFARYAAQHLGHLSFPFKRYQMQPCWRGERPQDGRFRQFLQCDLDVVSLDKLPLSFDAEVVLVAVEVLRHFPLGGFDFRISNRKILEGFITGLSPELPLQLVTRALDKLDKIGREKVLEALGQLGLTASQCEKCLEISTISTRDTSFVQRVRDLGIENEKLDLGLQELEWLMTRLHAEGVTEAVVDLSVTRGLDYYTGSVYEVRWSEFPKLGSIGAGGRYDDLAGNYTNQHLPGVGLSIGFTRIFSKLIAENRLAAIPPTPTQVMITWLEEDGQKAHQAARTLRQRGIPCEVFHENTKLLKQLNYANKKSIPYVYFDADGEIKNMISGVQEAIDLSSWTPA